MASHLSQTLGHARKVGLGLRVGGSPPLIGFLYGFMVDVRVNNNDNVHKHLYNNGITLPNPFSH